MKEMYPSCKKMAGVKRKKPSFYWKMMARLSKELKSI
jgi:hypothetical protein